MRTCLISYYHYAKELSFPLGISPVNVTKSDLVTFAGEIFNGKLHFRAVMTHYFQALNSSHKSRNTEMFSM